MLRHLVLVAVFSLYGTSGALAQAAEDPAPRMPLESPPPPLEAIGEAPLPADRLPFEAIDGAMALGESRGAVRICDALLPGERPEWVVVELAGSFPARTQRRTLFGIPLPGDRLGSTPYVSAA